MCFFLGSNLCEQEMLKKYQNMPSEHEGMVKVLIKGKISSIAPSIEIEVIFDSFFDKKLTKKVVCD